MTQTVSHKKVKPWQGILLIIGIVALLILINYLIILAGRLIGATAAAIVFWVIGILIVLWMYRTFVLTFQYTLDEDDEVLYISRRYGKRLRPITDVYLRLVQFVGTPEEAQKKFPANKKVRAVHTACKLPVTAVVYRTSSDTRTLFLQADDELKAKLVAYIKKK